MLIVDVEYERSQVGAQVMLLRNVDLDGSGTNGLQLVNGSRGVVRGTVLTVVCVLLVMVSLSVHLTRRLSVMRAW